MKFFIYFENTYNRKKTNQKEKVLAFIARLKDLDFPSENLEENEFGVLLDTHNTVLDVKYSEGVIKTSSLFYGDVALVEIDEKVDNLADVYWYVIFCEFNSEDLPKSLLLDEGEKHDDKNTVEQIVTKEQAALLNKIDDLFSDTRVREYLEPIIRDSSRKIFWEGVRVKS